MSANYDEVKHIDHEAIEEFIDLEYVLGSRTDYSLFDTLYNSKLIVAIKKNGSLKSKRMSKNWVKFGKQLGTDINLSQDKFKALWKHAIELSLFLKSTKKPLTCYKTISEELKSDRKERLEDNTPIATLYNLKV